MAIQVRPTVYRGQAGYCISGKVRKDQGWPVSIFTHTRASAERIRAKVKAGEEVKLDDFRDE